MFAKAETFNGKIPCVYVTSSETDIILMWWAWRQLLRKKSTQFGWKRKCTGFVYNVISPMVMWRWRTVLTHLGAKKSHIAWYIHAYFSWYDISKQVVCTYESRIIYKSIVDYFKKSDYVVVTKNFPVSQFIFSLQFSSVL